MTNDHYTYDDDIEMTRMEAIHSLMAEGYSEDEALRMIGEYDPEEYYEHDDDIPEMEDFPDADEYVDEEDFD